MRILVANLPSFKGKIFVKEGRCSQSKKFWNTIWPPYSLVSIAAVLERVGHEVKVFNYPASKFTPDSFRNFISSFSPEVVIANLTTPTADDDLEASLKIKQIIPNTKIVFFGIHATVFFKEVLEKYSHVDFIIRGEPEYSIEELILSLSSEKRSDWTAVKGLVWRNNGDVISNEDRELISDLDGLPMPAWHLIDIQNYKLPFIERPYLIVVPGRGCVDECLFCYAHIYYGRKNRRHSAERIINELIYYKKEFKINYFFFWTENFTQDKRFVKELLRLMFARNLDITWSCNSRVDTVDLDLLTDMKKAGCQMIAFGVESGVQEILDVSKKNITLSEIENAFIWARKAGLQTIANCIFGLPGETVKTMKQTMKFLKKLNPVYAQFYAAVPRPGSEFFNLAQKEGWIQTEDWGRFHQGDYILRMNDLNRDVVLNFRNRAKISFYLNFKRFFAIILNLCRTFIRGRQKA